MQWDNEQDLVPRRSFIFVPGNRPDMYPKALASGADIVCADLEDAIAPAEKETARGIAFSQLVAIPGYGEVERVIRINCLRTTAGMADVQTLLETAQPPPYLMLPKVKGPEEVGNLSDLLDEYKLPTRLHIIIETNEALAAVHEIARASRRNAALFFGGVDMAADLRSSNSWQALLYARSRLVHAAATYGLDAIDVPYLDLEDADGMLWEAEQARDIGYTGKGAIHPKQINAINAVFTPDEATVAHARKIVTAFAASEGGLLVVDGKLYEKPVLRSLARILAIHERVESISNG